MSERLFNRESALFTDPEQDAPEPIAPPADSAEALDRLRGLFAECEASARYYFTRSMRQGLDFDMRCAYAGLAGRLVRTAANLAGRLERSERATPRAQPAPKPD
jgi:hypothetical protein